MRFFVIPPVKYCLSGGKDNTFTTTQEIFDDITSQFKDGQPQYVKNYLYNPSTSVNPSRHGLVQHRSKRHYKLCGVKFQYFHKHAMIQFLDGTKHPAIKHYLEDEGVLPFVQRARDVLKWLREISCNFPVLMLICDTQSSLE